MVAFYKTGKNIRIVYNRKEPPMRRAQDWNPYKLSRAGCLVNAGPKIENLLHRAFAADHMRGGWFARSKALDEFLMWVRTHSEASYADVRKQIKSLEKEHPRMFTEKTTAQEMVDHYGGKQLTVGSKIATKDMPKPCPGCLIEISYEEAYAEAKGEYWHSMCAPKDKIVVGEWIDEEGEFVKPILLAEAPHAIDYLIRKIGD